MRINKDYFIAFKSNYNYYNTFKCCILRLNLISLKKLFSGKEAYAIIFMPLLSKRSCKRSELWDGELFMCTMNLSSINFIPAGNILCMRHDKKNKLLGCDFQRFISCGHRYFEDCWQFFTLTCYNHVPHWCR